MTAGGSAYFDVVAEVLAELAGGRTKVVVRAGAYIIHDDGFYTGISPFGRSEDRQARRLTSAMHAWARVVSRPEPGLALLDAGKRDVPFDEGLPTAQAVAGQLGATTAAPRRHRSHRRQRPARVPPARSRTARTRSACRGRRQARSLPPVHRVRQMALDPASSATTRDRSGRRRPDPHLLLIPGRGLTS